VCVLLFVVTVAFSNVAVKSCNIPPPYAGYAVWRSDRPNGDTVELAHRYSLFLDPTLPVAAQDLTERRAESAYVLAHELGHLATHTVMEATANAWARQHYCSVVLKLGYLHSCRALWRLLPVAWRELSPRLG
jgi:hypothetical protein